MKNVVNVINDNANELLKDDIIPDVKPVIENDIKTLLTEVSNFINDCGADKFMKVWFLIFNLYYLKKNFFFLLQDNLNKSSVKTDSSLGSESPKIGDSEININNSKV